MEIENMLWFIGGMICGAVIGAVFTYFYVMNSFFG
jgi:hypothetical protein